MEKTTKLRVLALSLAMAFGMLLPNAAFAQSDDFFRSEDNFNGNRFAADWAIINNGIGQSEAPLGSGLLILSAVGAGYAVARRKRHNGIKAIIIITALIGVTSCRKNLDTVNEVAQHGVYITLNVDGGEKVAVNPTGGDTYATVTWEDDDILYVGNNGAYCGYLEYDGTKFGGTINPTSDGDYLHFYFMGNKGTTSEPTSVNITDQTSKYPVISYGRSTTLYNSGTTSYSATLYNKCAIVKFPISGAGTDENITLRGMNNTVTVNFAANNGATTGNPYTFSKTGDGEITLHAESATEKWAIVLPQDAVVANLYADGYETVTVSVPAIVANTYHNNDISPITLTADYVFSVSSTKKVHFSPGNLQYQASTDTWRFAEHQWDYVGDATKGNVYVNEEKCNNKNISPSYDGWIDLFGWGTGDNPIKGYDDYSYNSTFNDWGDHCGDPTGNSYTWSTLSSNEWTYLLGNAVDPCRNNAINLRKLRTVNGVYGLVILPDDCTSNIDDDWGDLESVGAVFLPAAGLRQGTGVYSVGELGLCWSSTAASGYDDQAYYVSYASGVESNYDARNQGFSVRLVR